MPRMATSAELLAEEYDDLLNAIEPQNAGGEAQGAEAKQGQKQQDDGDDRGIDMHDLRLYKNDPGLDANRITIDSADQATFCGRWRGCPVALKARKKAVAEGVDTRARAPS